MTCPLAGVDSTADPFWVTLGLEQLTFLETVTGVSNLVIEVWCVHETSTIKLPSLPVSFITRLLASRIYLETSLKVATHHLPCCLTKEKCWSKSLELIGEYPPSPSTPWIKKTALFPCWAP